LILLAISAMVERSSPDSHTVAAALKEAAGSAKMPLAVV